MQIQKRNSGQSILGCEWLITCRFQFVRFWWWNKMYKKIGQVGEWMHECGSDSATNLSRTASDQWTNLQFCPVSPCITSPVATQCSRLHWGPRKYRYSLQQQLISQPFVSRSNDLDSATVLPQCSHVAVLCSPDQVWGAQQFAIHKNVHIWHKQSAYPSRKKKHFYKS